LGVQVAEVPMQDTLWAEALRCRGLGVWLWEEVEAVLAAGEGQKFVDLPVNEAGDRWVEVAGDRG
jgi:hypothetical protein